MDKTFYFVLVFVVLISFSYCISIEDDDEDEVSPWNRCPWIRNKLKKGRVKIRNRGRIAKFICDPGYELVGKRFATCVRGQWNYPLPVCVARGCSSLPDVRNARVSEEYRGAVLTYDCLPGYTLEGTSTLYCDGRRWTSTVPTCVATTSATTSCDFEDPDLCGWTQDTTTHDFDWKRNQFSTPSGHSGTGPSYDHTFGIGKGGFYLYQEASAPRKPNDVSRLFSPVFSADKSGGCFLIWYHMYGSSIGGLKLYIKPESHVFGELLPAWELYGDQGNDWYRANISIPRYSENFQIVIEGVRGANYIGDTAIDDVYLTNVSCEDVSDTHENITFTASNSCRGRCRESNMSSYCGCNDDCHSNGNCCFDFPKICTGNYDVSESENSSEEQDSNSSTSTTENTSTRTTNSGEMTNSEVSSSGSVSYNSSEAQFTTSYSVPNETTLSTTALPFVPETTFTQLVSTTTHSTLSTSAPATTKQSSLSTTDLASTTNMTAISSTTKTTPPTTTVSSSLSMTPSTVTFLHLVTSTTNPNQTTKAIQTTTSTIIPLTTSSTQNAGAITASIRPTTANGNTVTVLTSSIVSYTSPQTSTVTTTSNILSSPNESDSSNFPSSTNRLPSTTLPPTTTEIATTSTLAPTTSTRKIYNLRPRNRTLAPFPSMYTTRSPFFYYSTSATRTTSYPVVRTSWFYLRTTRSSTTTKITSPTSTVRLTTPQTTIRTTELSSEERDNYASKSASTAANNSHSTITIVAIVVGILMCVGGGGYYMLKKRVQKRQSKLSDDSEMRFLSENEISDYSDPSALEKILTN